MNLLWKNVQESFHSSVPGQVSVQFQIFLLATIFLILIIFNEEEYVPPSFFFFLKENENDIKKKASLTFLSITIVILKSNYFEKSLTLE